MGLGVLVHLRCVKGHSKVVGKREGGSDSSGTGWFERAVTKASRDPLPTIKEPSGGFSSESGDSD